MVTNLYLGEIDWSPLKSFVNIVRTKLHFFCIFVTSIELLSSCSTNFYFISIKVIAILVIKYHFAYHNNSNYNFF